MKFIIINQSRIRNGFFALFFFTSLVVSNISCKKYLDKKRDTGLVTPTTLADLQGLMDDSKSMNEGITPGFGEASADDYFLLPQNYASQPTRFQQAYIWKPYDYFFENDWSRGYHAIYNANYCLEMLEEIPATSGNQSLWQNVKGSSLFFRAYYFLWLTWSHAKAYDENTSANDPGIALRLKSDQNEPSKRANVRECYERIINDVKESIIYLPEIAVHSFRPSRIAAYGLLARTYLSMRKYDSAFRYSNLYLQIKNSLINYNGDTDFLGESSTTPFKRFNKETIFFSDMNVFNTITTNIVKIDTSLFLSYASNDRRRNAYFLTAGLYKRFKGTYAQSTGSVYFTGIATDEMFLTRAECYARAGDKVAALNDLNTLLATRYNNTFAVITAVDANAALDRILIERRKELIFRGLRWIDIKRLNKEGRNIIPTRFISGQTYTLQPNANYYALPLPTDVINLSGMPQNSY